MKKILSFLPRIAMIVVFLLMSGITLVMAYILFAPDTMPKPFYIMSYDAAAAKGETGDGKATQEPATAETPPSAPINLHPGQGIMLDTGSKIVNLVDPTGRKYLRAGIVLEFAPTDLKYYTMTAEEKKAFTTQFTDDLNTKLPVINDIIIMLLSNQTFESVYTADGKEKLRRSIIDDINSQLPENHVIFVYFTEFVVQ